MIEKNRLTFQDITFIVFLIVMLFLLGWTGYLSYIEGMKTEVSKRNGEAWVSWFNEASAMRFNANYEPSECAGVSSFNDDTKFISNVSPHTWGECLKAISTSQLPLAKLTNPFFNIPLTFVEKCNKGEHNLSGAMVIEKLTPNPAGSSLPFTTSQLIESDRIDQKIKLQVTICDGGAYPVFISEVQF